MSAANLFRSQNLSDRVSFQATAFSNLSLFFGTLELGIG
jgi:hypothetical protein